MEWNEMEWNEMEWNEMKSRAAASRNRERKRSVANGIIPS